MGAPSFLGGLGGMLGGGLRGVLDFRQTLINQRNDLLNPLVQQMQQEQAQTAKDQTRLAMGQTGEGLSGPDGIWTDLGPATGLLADPRFADNKSELTFAANLMGNRATQAVGSQILNNVISTQQTVDATQEKNRAELELSVLDQLRKQREEQRTIAQQTFTRGQQLESDYAAAIAPVATAVDNFRGLQNSVNTQNPLATVANVFQLAKLFDPGARTVTEGDVTTIQGSFPMIDQINNALVRIQGGGWSPQTAQNILAIAQTLARSTIEGGQATYDNFLGRADRNQVDRREVVGRFGLDRVYGVEGGIDALLGQQAQYFTDSNPAPVPPGLSTGRAPGSRQSVREQRGR